MFPDPSTAIAKWFADAAAHSLTTLLTAFGSTTEPDFTAIVPAYNRVLAVCVLLVGAMAAFALIEHMLGGASGAGLRLVPRSLFAIAAAFFGINGVRLATDIANALGGAWTPEIAGNGSKALLHIAAAFVSSQANPTDMSGPLVSLVGLSTAVLALLVYVELLVRSALILVSTVFWPLACALAIWPRFGPILTHLAEFLMSLLLTKFVIVTSIYVGLGLLAGGANGAGIGELLMGVAVLVMAAMSPAALMQGIKFAEAGTSSMVRGWTASTVGIAGTAAGVAIGGGAGLAIAGMTNSSRGGSFYLTSLIANRSQEAPQASAAPPASPPAASTPPSTGAGA